MTTIRLTNIKDAGAMLGIYQPFISGTVVTFEEEVPSLSDFENRIIHITKNLPWLVCEIDGEIAGYAYASEHRERVSYRWSKEVSVYVAAQYKRSGIGNGLYTSLIDILRMQGVKMILAGITLPNEPSVRFHESFGFRQVGIYHKIGYKMGQWQDVGWWELQLNELNHPIDQLIDIHSLKNTRKFDHALEKGMKKISQ